MKIEDQKTENQKIENQKAETHECTPETAEVPLTFRCHNFVSRTKAFGLDDRARAMIWFQGCSHHPHCKGCMSEETWNPDGGKETEISKMVMKILNTSDIAGLVLSGGEVFDQPDALLMLLKQLKEYSQRDLDVMIYTGFTLEELLKKENPVIDEVLAQYTDVLVDGRYVEELNDGIPMRGSSNQNIYPLSNRYSETDLLKCMERKQQRPNPRKVELHVTDGRLVLVGIPQKEELDRIRTFFSGKENVRRSV